MRQKMITLCLTSFEIAQKKRNFSQWVRQKLLDEVQVALEERENRQLYGAYCKLCDITAANPHDYMMKNYYCKKCGDSTEYLGLIE
ncbi:MAG: hypothetical protein [Circular genetic element sp.]|nr:MAG: hypothetical protein [Circular genetic element sp.]